MKIILGAILLMVLLPLAISSEAVLWDLIIDVTVENNGLFQGESPIISGVVTDHAGKPVDSTKIHIRAGQDSVFLTTNETGQFKVKLYDFDRIPGNYIVNVKGISPDGKTGLATVKFQVKGNLQPFSASEQQLSTPEAKKYLNINPEDIKGNPIATKIYNYYKNIHENYLQEKKLAEDITKEQIFIQEQKRLAKESLQKAIAEKRPGAGVYSGYKYQEFVENLDPSVKGIIENQLNYTKDTFAEAQIAMSKVLENGGTEKEARKVYLSKLGTTKDFMDNLTTNQTSSISKTNQTQIDIQVKQNQTSVEQLQNKNNTNTAVSKQSIESFSLQELMFLGDITITTEGDSIFINVNGTTFEFILNGTDIIPIDE